MSITGDSSLILTNDKVENIRAFVRMRGLNIHELGGNLNGSYSPADAAVTSWKVLDDNTIVQTTNTGEALPKKIGKTYFNFDKVMGASSSNQEVYENTTQDIVKDFIQGYSGSVITYGQTGAGKTYTMQGPRSLEEGIGGGGGILHLAACDIFSNIQECSDSVFLIRLSVIEIYNEEIRDLLINPKDETNALNRYDTKEGLMTFGGTEKLILNYQTMIETLSLAESRRVVRATGMNERSSRSHTIFSFVLERKYKDGNNVFFSRLNMVDLAGSDSVHKVASKLDSNLDKEGKAINKSLLALSNVISGLSRSKKSFINFRDSNLTRVLQRYLTGKDRVSIICCISPSGMSTEQTRKTLEFGKKARAAQTMAKLDVINNDRSLILLCERSPFPITAQISEIKKSIIDGSGYQERKKKIISESSDKIDEAAMYYSTLSSSKSDDSSTANQSEISTSTKSTSNPKHQHVSESLSGESAVSSFASSEATFLEIQEQWSSYKSEASLKLKSNDEQNQHRLEMVSNLKPNDDEEKELLPGVNSTESRDINYDTVFEENEDDDLLLVYTRTDDTNEAIASDVVTKASANANITNGYFERSALGLKEDIILNPINSQSIRIQNKPEEIAMTQKDKCGNSLPSDEEKNTIDETLCESKGEKNLNESKRVDTSHESAGNKTLNESKEDSNYSESETDHAKEIINDELNNESLIATKKRKVFEKKQAALAALSTRKESTGVLKMLRGISNTFKTHQNDSQSYETDSVNKNDMQIGMNNDKQSPNADIVQKSHAEADKIRQSSFNLLNKIDIEDNENEFRRQENRKDTTKFANDRELQLLEWEQLSESFRLFRDRCKNTMY